MNVYVHAFKFREPFQTLVDAELILACEKSSFDIVKGLNRTIQAETKPMITQCCMQALYQTNNQLAIEIAKRFERRRCNHQPTKPEEPAVCIKSIADIDGENKHRYIVASQDQKLRSELREVPGVPMVFMNRSVMVMEPLSEASKVFSEKFESKKLTHGLNETGKEKPQEGPISAKKRKGPKEPNPLSIKKKKNTKPTTPEEPKKKRRRTHRKQNTEESNESEKVEEKKTSEKMPRED